ncbi:MAG: patatin-like phospholipase family protein [Candidatus Acidiferrales bacterium]
MPPGPQTTAPPPVTDRSPASTVADAPAPRRAQRRPRLGLVLEGGGALGLAHIGVIQWLEDHHIPVSYVAGTSMGGLVGGVYATGHSPKEIEQLIAGINWDTVIRGQTPFEDLTFRRKQDAVDYPNSLEFGLRHGVQFPEGFNSGQQVGLIFDQIALPYSEIHNFNDLPIPFGCVSTDLVTGKEEIFRSGSLSLALRSTMSLPGIFTPVREQQHIFADGALLDNLPVDVAQDMGADVTVAVHLEVKPLDPKESLSTFTVLGRSLSVVIAANELRSMEKADVLISVPLGDYSSLDYSKSSEMIKLGYAAAESKKGVLMAFSVDDDSWSKYLEHRNSRRRTGSPTPQFVKVQGTGPELTTIIQNKLQVLVGKPIDAKTLDQQLALIMGNGRFDSLGYKVVEEDGKQGLLITAVEKPYAPPTVQPLIALDGSDYLNPVFAVGGRITFYDFGGFGRELRNDIILGAEYGISSEYYVPLHIGSNWFIAPRAFAQNSPFYEYNQDKLEGEYRNRQYGGEFDFGYEFGRDAELRVGYQAANLTQTLRIGTPTLPPESGRVGFTKVSFEMNRLDNAVIPRAGTGLDLTWRWNDANPGANQQFPTAFGRFRYFKKVGVPDSIYFTAQGGTTFGVQQVGLPVFGLGGVSDLRAYGTNELLTNQYYYFQAGYLREVLALPPFLGDKLYVIGGYEIAKPFALPAADGLTLSSRLPMDATGGFIANTIFGPILIGGAVGDADHHRFFFQVGRVF